MPSAETAITVCGIRHHGPGSARSVATVLDRLRPSAVVLEGPPELDGVLGWAGAEDLVPPVAALAYRPDRPARSLFYPMASSSPEWVALRWATAAGAAVRFADLPAANALADEAPERRDPGGVDIIGELAAAAGYEDAERWWEDAVEHRHTAADGFAAITEAVAAIREDRDPLDGSGSDPSRDLGNARREAAMRRVLRAVAKEGHADVVVVCGAYHAPALEPAAWPSKAADDRLLKGLPKSKVAVTWVPWTARRLSVASGYGAGVASPGWYAHCHEVDEAVRTESWMVKVARALRAADLPAPPASAVEAARLADALAALRGRPSPGLAECTDAALAVLCGGRPEPLQVIVDEVVVGHAIGSVPDDVPQVPLARDLEVRARSARLRRSAEDRTQVLDLRTPAGLAKSTLLHRLRLLGIPWGRPADAGGTAGTFKEAWTTRWEPELSVAVIEASTWGATVEDAAAARATDLAAQADDLRGVVDVLDRCLPADLPAAALAITDEVDRRAAGTTDAVLLMRAAEPLAATCRYGDVRQLDTSALRHVLDALVRRVAAGLATAVTGLDADAAASARAGIDGTVRAVRLLDDPDLSALWLDAVAGLLDRPMVPAGITGRATRLLLDAGRLPAEDAAARLSRALSHGQPAGEAAAWVDGFLEGDATLLLLDPTLLGVLDGWVAGAPPAVFDDLLPLLRRTFGRYSPAERGQLGSRLRHGRRVVRSDRPVDAEAARPAVAHVLALLGAPARTPQEAGDGR